MNKTQLTPPHFSECQGKLLFGGWFACLRSHRHRADARSG